MVRCDEIAWSLLGISMAGYNFILSIGLSLIPVYTILKWKRSKAVM